MYFHTGRQDELKVMLAKPISLIFYNFDNQDRATNLSCLDSHRPPMQTLLLRSGAELLCSSRA